MGVMLQAFYWDCPQTENREHQWWSFIKSKLPEIAQAGFTALWLPPANKAASWKSMGYDPYDYYDLGEFDQKGGVPTWFGSRAELLDLIESAHALGLQVYADLVFNHNSGADAQESNPIDGQLRWTKFTPKSGKFPRDWKCFHPSQYETWDGGTFGDMPDLCHRTPLFIPSSLIMRAGYWKKSVSTGSATTWSRVTAGGWSVRFRNCARCAAAPASNLMRSANAGIANAQLTIGSMKRTHGRTIQSAHLIFRCAGVCAICATAMDSVCELSTEPGVLMWGRPEQAVTFVENHDVVRDSPIINDKLLAYAFILTHEGYPCVFWQDYFNWNLAQPDNQSGIDALVKVHEQNAAGSTQVLFVDDDLYIMQRSGTGDQSGLILVLNNRGTWNGTWVQTRWNNTRLIPAAWRGRDDLGAPAEKWTNESGWVDLWAAPRGYAVCVPA